MVSGIMPARSSIFRARGQDGAAKPHFIRESDIRDQFDKLIPHVIRVLKARYGLTVVKIGRTSTWETEVDAALLGAVLGPGMAIVRKAGSNRVVVRVQEDVRRRLKHGAEAAETRSIRPASRPARSRTA
jgi:hypothetical protein